MSETTVAKVMKPAIFWRTDEGTRATMRTFDVSPDKESLQNQETHDELVARTGSAFGTDQLADNDLLSAIAPVPCHASDGVGDPMLSTTIGTWDGADSIGH